MIIYKKLKEIYYWIQKFHRTLQIRNKQVCIISNNCWGGFMYQSCNLPYSSPLIGLYFYAPEYIKFLKNLKYNINQPLHFIKKEQSKYSKYISKNYIIGVLGNTGIEIVFMHYHNEAEVLEKWERRKKRIDYTNMIVKFSDTDCCRDDKLIYEFDKLPFKYKVCFTGKPYPECQSVKFMTEFKTQGYALYEWAYSYKYYNFVKEANSIIKK